MKQKVLIYVFNSDKHLLVFDHDLYPEVSPQVPAGSIEFDEDPESAALRELAEESGIIVERTDRKVGVYNYKTPNNELHQRHVYVIELTFQCSQRWSHIVSSGEQDKGYQFNYYWLPIEAAKDKLVGSMGKYLRSYTILRT